MTVVQIISSISAVSAGPSHTIPALCQGLEMVGCDVSLYFGGPPVGRDFDFPAFRFPFASFPHPKLGRAPGMRASLLKAARTADIFHNNSFWMYPNVYPFRVKGECLRETGRSPFLVNAPRGTLSPWALRRHWIRKKLFGRFAGQFAAMAGTDMWHATCAKEYEEIRAQGYRQPIAIIPNGVDLPGALEVEERPRRRLFFLSRIHPTKNVELLIRCWSELEGQFPDWDLSIVGPDVNNPYADAMKTLVQSLGCRRITFEGELRGDAKQRFMASSDCEVLPTHTENFGMVVAEALACGTPVICSRGAPWEGLESNQCGWWVPLDHAAFRNAMTEAMSQSRSVLRQMGKRGQEWMVRDFSWTEIGNKMRDAYTWLLHQGERPNWVVVD